jgi:hypothetical protein
MKLLSKSFKILKSDHSGKGYITVILYLSPASESGYQLCPFRTPACEAACLGHSSGRMVMDASKAARIRRTVMLMQERVAFGNQIIKEIAAHERKASKLDVLPAVRLNGDSDVRWDTMRFDGKTLMEHFPGVVFYDYTKWPNHLRPDSDIHLTFSRGETTTNEEIQANLDNGRNVAVVFHSVPATWNGWTVIDGDADDLRFLDPTGVIVGLKAKGKARKDTSGFVV